MNDSIRYTVRILNPITHYAEVEGRFPTFGAEALELFLPVWTPGSYLVREYVRHIEGLSAPKTRKNRWLVSVEGAEEIVVQYRVYCRDLSVRGNFIDDRFALLQGAATFVTAVGHLHLRHEVTLELPASWRTSVCGLPGIGHVYTAENYDALADSPMLAGNPDVHEFAAGGKPHYLVNEGADGAWNAEESGAALTKLVEYNSRFWGSLPYEKFVFLNLLGEGKAGGGLEHRNSFCVLASRYAQRTREAYASWLSLVSHEYFHTWNVKRLRPAALGPFDYENENYTKDLWVAEGITSYYDDLILARTGLISRDEYLTGVEGSERFRGLSGTIETLQTTPGRLAQSAAEASYDAWIKFYRPDENTPNTAISYYTKGAVVAFLLDMKIRRTTGGAKSLDDAMRLAYERFAGERGFAAEEFRETLSETAGVDLSEWLHDAIDTTKELDYTEVLEYLGLRFQAPQGKDKASLGFKTRTEHGRICISQIPRGKDQGFAVDDELLALGDYRVLPDQWAQRMEQLRPGERVTVLVARRGKLIRVETVLENETKPTWKLELTGEPTPELTAWLGQPQPR